MSIRRDRISFCTLGWDGKKRIAIAANRRLRFVRREQSIVCEVV